MLTVFLFSKLCVCGLTKSQHIVRIANANSDIEWTVENNTVDDGLTDAYGEIFFKNFSEYSENKAQVERTLN